MVDAALVEQARRGDDDAFERIVDAEGDRCYAIAFRILRDRGLAEDAVQHAFLQAWQALPKLRDATRFTVWLHRLLINACYAELRRQRRWKGRLTLLPLDGPLGRDPHASVDDRDALERAFERLSPDRRAIFVLHHHAGMPLATIAQVLGVSVGTVKSRLHYSTATLRGALEADARDMPEARRA